MAINKHALLRYKVLDKCFGNPGKRYFIEDLKSECEQLLKEIDPESKGISRRQILADIRFMESSDGWEIELIRHKEGKRVYFHYADSSFSINNMPLNELEINQLQDAIGALSQFEGMPQFEWVGALLPKLMQGKLTKRDMRTIMQFESNPFLKGIERLGELYNAINYKKVLSVQYQPYEIESPYALIIHPYLLKQYNSRWFLFGYNPERQKHNWNLAIDRIVSLREVAAPFHENKVIDWEEYFDDFIGVTQPEKAEIEKIVLRFSGKTARYIETKPLHGSQKVKWLDNETLEVTLQLMINYELERLILSYADSVIVLQPAHLSNSIKSRLCSAIGQYC
jgi:predicted DNA-binding transcriptional regulator YafY